MPHDIKNQHTTASAILPVPEPNIPGMGCLAPYGPIALQTLYCNSGHTFHIKVNESTIHENIKEHGGFCLFTVTNPYACNAGKLVAAGKLSHRKGETLVTSQKVIIKIRCKQDRGVSEKRHRKEQKNLQEAYKSGFTPAFLAEATMEGDIGPFHILLEEYISHHTIENLGLYTDCTVIQLLIQCVKEMNRLKLRHWDLAPRNVLFDQRNKKLWIIDLEELEILAKPLSGDEYDEMIEYILIDWLV